MSNISQAPLNQPYSQTPPPVWTEWRGAVSILAQCRDHVAFLPSGYPLRCSTFSRREKHLVVQAPDCPEVIVAKFFGGANLTTLATVDGVQVSRHMVLLMSNLSSRVEEALSGLVVSASD